MNFILEEDYMSSLQLHDLECSISSARDSLEHSCRHKWMAHSSVSGTTCVCGQNRWY